MLKQKHSEFFYLSFSEKKSKPLFLMIMKKYLVSKQCAISEIEKGSKLGPLLYEETKKNKLMPKSS